MLTDVTERCIHCMSIVYVHTFRYTQQVPTTPVTSIVYTVCLLDVSGHLSHEQRSRFKTLDDNMDFLSQEMKRDVITDYLRQRDLLTEDQYQHVIAMTFHQKANKYLLQLIRSEPGEYLRGMKEALVKAKQPELIDYLP